MQPMSINRPYLLFLGDAWDDLSAKTAIGVWQWRPDECVGQLRLPGCVPSVDLPELSVAEGWERGARTLLVGVVNRGGCSRRSGSTPWSPPSEVGMDIASGLHARLGAIPAVAEAARRHGRSLHDVRHPEGSFPIGTGEPRSGRPAPHRRHGLLGGQDVHDPLPAARPRRARGRLRLPRDRADRHLHRGLGNRGGRDRLGLHVRGHRAALPGRLRRPLGPHRGSGLALPSLLRRREPRAAARRPARHPGPVP